MATGYESNHVDFDDLFDLWVTGAKAPDTGWKYNNVDLSQRYQALAAGGTQGPNVNWKSGNVDLAAIFAQKGSTSP